MRFVMQTPESEPWLVLAEGRHGGKPHLRVEAPLYIEGRTRDTYSDEMKRIYGLESEEELRRNG